DLIPYRFKELLLYHHLNRLANQISVDECKTFFHRFEQYVSDTTLIANIREEFALDFDQHRTLTDSVILMDSNKHYHSLQSFLSANNGKIIYVELSARRGVPCREAMPESHQLRAAYQNKSVGFLYLSRARQ